VIRVPERDRLKAYLEENGVGSDIYYPLSLHMQECFRDLGYRAGDFPESEKAAREVLALPIHSALSEEDIDYVCAQIRGRERASHAWTS
jgi:dTDP-4-amino-4,6-dideoxygalactose transaminase